MKNNPWYFHNSTGKRTTAEWHQRMNLLKIRSRPALIQVKMFCSRMSVTSPAILQLENEEKWDRQCFLASSWMCQESTTQRQKFQEKAKHFVYVYIVSISVPNQRKRAFQVQTYAKCLNPAVEYGTAWNFTNILPTIWVLRNSMGNTIRQVWIGVVIGCVACTSVAKM